MQVNKHDEDISNVWLVYLRCSGRQPGRVEGSRQRRREDKDWGVWVAGAGDGRPVGTEEAASRARRWRLVGQGRAMMWPGKIVAREGDG